jgi:hypothetical protein
LIESWDKVKTIALSGVSVSRKIRDHEVGSKDPYLTLELIASNEWVEVKRTYFKMIDALAAIGGLVDVFPIIVI